MSLLSRIGQASLDSPDFTGNVGIGTTEANSPLEVAKSVPGVFNGLDITNLIEDDVSGKGSSLTFYTRASRDVYGRIGYFRNTSPDGRFLDFANSDNVSGNAFRFLFGANEKVRISQSGDMGIGTPTPTSKLQVVGLPTYADNTAALAGGLTAGAFYRTSTGVLMVAY